MTKFVYKEVCPLIESFSLNLPEGSEIIHLAVQNGSPCIWFVADPKIAKISRRFIWVGTGHEMSSSMNLKHLGTILVSNDSLVFHLFEVLK